jgi:LysR family glycine cleavage system transcriptional activator
MFNDSSLLLQAAVQGQGVALARSSLVGTDLHEGRLVRLFDVSVPSEYAYYLAYPPRLLGTGKLDAFRAWMVEQVQGGAGIATGRRGRPARGSGRAAARD